MNLSIYVSSADIAAGRPGRGTNAICLAVNRRLKRDLSCEIPNGLELMIYRGEGIVYSFVPPVKATPFMHDPKLSKRAWLKPFRFTLPEVDRMLVRA